MTLLDGSGETAAVGVVSLVGEATDVGELAGVAGASGGTNRSPFAGIKSGEVRQFATIKLETLVLVRWAIADKESPGRIG